MKSKQILSIILILVIVFAMAATACGKKEEAAEKEEPKQEETSDTDEEEADEEDDTEAADEEEVSADKVKKTGEDTLTEEDIQSLKDSIRDTVISEYLEPNRISAEEFEWPDVNDESWEYFAYQKSSMEIYLATDVEIAKEKEPSTQNQELMEAVLNGITYWLDNQGSYDAGYFVNTVDKLSPYSEVIPTIDLASK